MNRKPRSSNRGAFTLIELAVCVLLVLVVAVTSLPLLRMSVIESGRVACRAHLRELSVGHLAWAADHNGWLVTHAIGSPPRHPDGSPRYDGGGILVRQNRLMFHAATLGTNGYVELPQTWHCPSDKEDLNGFLARPATSYDIASGAFRSDGNISYVYVAGYNSLSSPESLATAPVLADESNHREQGSMTPGNMPALDDSDNHGASFRNVMYLDGHVAGLEGVDAVNGMFGGWAEPWRLEGVD